MQKLKAFERRARIIRSILRGVVFVGFCRGFWYSVWKGKRVSIREVGFSPVKSSIELSRHKLGGFSRFI